MAVYTYLWRFRVSPGAEEEFRRHYGPDGTWAALFRRAPGYLDTRLLADLDRPSEFVTIDRWRYEESFLEFRRRFAREFAELDEWCATLTENETQLGSYTES